MYSLHYHDNNHYYCSIIVQSLFIYVKTICVGLQNIYIGVGVRLVTVVTTNITLAISFSTSFQKIIVA